MHGLQLRVVAVEPLQRRHAQQLAAEAVAEERHRWIEQRVHVEGMDVLGRRMESGEREMAFQQGTHIVGPGVINRDLDRRHYGAGAGCRIVRSAMAERTLPANSAGLPADACPSLPQPARTLARPAGARLPQSGLLTRMRDPHDRRGVLLELTARGREKLDEYIDLEATREVQLLTVLDPDEKQQLNHLLRKLMRSRQSELGSPPSH